MKAVINDDNNAKFVTDRPKPKLRDDYILIKTHSVALNPTDWKHSRWQLSVTGSLLGSDYAGTVEEVGPAVTKKFKKGDRVCGCAHGGNRSQLEDGTFAEWIVAKGDIQMHIPDAMTFEDAATIGLGSITCGQGLYQKALQLALPAQPIKDKQYVLIYGGSTATGVLGMQYAKLSGYDVLTTCSSKHNDRMRALGATPFDYGDPNCGQKIREFTNNTLKYAWDTIGKPSSVKICADALSSQPGSRYGCLEQVQFSRNDVEVTSTLMYSCYGDEFEKAGMSFKHDLVTTDHEFAKQFFGITEDLLNSGKLKTHAVRVKEGGLEGVPSGLRDMENGGVSNEKWIYHVASP